jgi:hypothetical protein
VIGQAALHSALAWQPPAADRLEEQHLAAVALQALAVQERQPILQARQHRFS